MRPSAAYTALYTEVPPVAGAATKFDGTVVNRLAKVDCTEKAGTPLVSFSAVPETSAGLQALVRKRASSSVVPLLSPR